MNVAQLKTTLKNGQRVYGTLVTSPSPHWPEHLARLGLDFVFIDTEHIPIGRETLSWMCRVYAALDLVPVVRIPSPDPYAASQALDGGAAGIVAPYIESAEEVRRLVGAVKYKPLKGRLLEGFQSGKPSMEQKLGDYISERNKDHLLFVMIESVPGMEQLDEILAVPGLDGIMVGPHDLSCSLGVPEQYESPRFAEAIRSIVSTTRDKGLAAGVHFMNCGSTDLSVEWIKMGINVHIQHADVVYAARGVQADIAAIREALGEKAVEAAGNLNLEI